MPYNYVLEPSITKLMDLSMKNRILIFDEAHNIEGVAEDGSSFKITTKDLKNALSELRAVKEKVREIISKQKKKRDRQRKALEKQLKA